LAWGVEALRSAVALDRNTDMLETILSAKFGRRGVAGVAISLLALSSVRAKSAEATPSIGIDNFTFAPAMLNLPVGATVTWVNHDDIPHSIVCPALGLKSRAMDTDQSFSSRIDQAGSFEYYCGIHPHMRGKLIVAG
jgi:plastocyanin